MNNNDDDGNKKAIMTDVRIAIAVVVVCLLLGFVAASLWALWEPK